MERCPVDDTILEPAMTSIPVRRSGHTTLDEPIGLNTTSSGEVMMRCPKCRIVTTTETRQRRGAEARAERTRLAKEAAKLLAAAQKRGSR